MARAQPLHVYIMTNRPYGTLYIGATSDLTHRVRQHRTHALPGFADRYNLTQLVWYETHATMQDGLRREKALKRWNRLWKLELIEGFNPRWRDLWPDLPAPSATI